MDGQSRENVEMETGLSDKTATGITPAEEIAELEDGLSTVRYDGDYGFDEFLSGGGASSYREVISFMTENRKLKTVYANCSDIKYFADRMYSVWESLPGNIQNIEPFWTLCYADDPLSWGDEEQTRNIYEYMLNYYIEKEDP